MRLVPRIVLAASEDQKTLEYEDYKVFYCTRIINLSRFLMCAIMRAFYNDRNLNSYYSSRRRQ